MPRKGAMLGRASECLTADERRVLTEYIQRHGLPAAKVNLAVAPDTMRSLRDPFGRVTVQTVERVRALLLNV
jgi:hypothetical protein